MMIADQVVIIAGAPEVFGRAAARVGFAHDNIRAITVFPRTTATDSGKTGLGDQATRARQRAGASPDACPVASAERVANRIPLAARKKR